MHSDIVKTPAECTLVYPAAVNSTHSNKSHRTPKAGGIRPRSSIPCPEEYVSVLRAGVRARAEPTAALWAYKSLRL